MVSLYCHAADTAHQAALPLLNDFSEALQDEEQLALAFQPRIDLLKGNALEQRLCCGGSTLFWGIFHPQSSSR
jgi:hypothetical protein